MSEVQEKLTDYIDINGQGVLHYYAGCISLSHYQSNKLIAYLLDHGCEINCQDSMGRTPLHIAVKVGNVTSLNMLLANGADPNIIDNEGKTAFNHTCQNLGMGTHTLNKIEAYRLLANYINKMIVAGCSISKQNKSVYEQSLKTYYCYFCHSDFRVHSKELEKMENIYLNNQVTVKNFLEMKAKDILKLMHSDILENFMNNEVQEYPMFSCLLRMQYTKGLDLQKPMNKAQFVLGKAAGFSLPYLCFQNILLYLDHSDVENIGASLWVERQSRYCKVRDFSNLFKAIVKSL